MNRKFNLLSPENKDYPEDLQHENGFYENICCNCKEHFFGHKRRVTCKVCSEGAKNTEQQVQPDNAEKDVPFGYYPNNEFEE
jgi:hypothetical protein